MGGKWGLGVQVTYGSPRGISKLLTNISKITYNQSMSNPNIAKYASLGGKARANKLSEARRMEIANKATQTRFQHKCTRGCVCRICGRDWLKHKNEHIFYDLIGLVKSREKGECECIYSPTSGIGKLTSENKQVTFREVVRNSKELLKDGLEFTYKGVGYQLKRM